MAAVFLCIRQVAAPFVLVYNS